MTVLKCAMHIGLSELGGIVGLIGGLLVFYDRYYKGRPVASLTISEKSSGRKLVCVRIKNTTPYDVAILDAKNKQGVYYLTEDEATRSLVAGAMGAAKFAFMLKPDETRELIIMSHFDSGVPVEVKKRYVEFAIYWRRGNATWLPQVPLLVCSTTYVIRRLGGVQ
jgi:hypothetical protein